MSTGVVVLAIASWIQVSGGAWVPTVDELSTIRTELRPFVEQAAVAEHQQLPPWDTYTFQYQGQVEGGRRFVFVNALCSQHEPLADLREELVLVFDGGPCYFNVKYDPAQRKFFDLQFNGEA